MKCPMVRCEERVAYITKNGGILCCKKHYIEHFTPEAYWVQIASKRGQKLLAERVAHAMELER